MASKKNYSKNESKKSWKIEFDELFNECVSYISKQRKYIYAVILVFFASSFIAFFNSDNFSFFDEFLREIADKTGGLDFFEMIWFIFSNNTTSAITSLFLGAFFGIFPFFNSLFNGAILGYVYVKAVPIAGFGVIWRLLPHGIFELPAIFISLGLGVHLGLPFVTRHFKYHLNNKNIFMIILSILLFPGIILINLPFNKELRIYQFSGFKIRFNQSLKAFLVVVLPLLMIASIIESALIFLMG